MIKPASLKNPVVRLLCCLLLLLFIGPQITSAHAVLVESDPPPNSRLTASPEQISLVFNERLEKQLYYIHVYDQHGRNVVQTKTEMSLDQRTISQKLPPLDDGVYTVSYHVISADGHPVAEAYTITVGQPTNKTATLAGYQGGHQHGGTGMWFDRFLYYTGLLALTGWLFWGMFSTPDTETARKASRIWLRWLKFFYLFMLLGMGFIQISALLGENGLAELEQLLLQTVFGQTWLFSVLLALIGCFLLGRSKWFDSVWGFLLLAAEGINGHAFTFEPRILAVPLDMLHLMAAAIWSGGLLRILVFWQRDRAYLKRFIPAFSRAAFVGILALALSGIGLTLIFIPKLSDLLATTWGILLLIKIALVVMVIIVAGVIRSLIKKGLPDDFYAWFKKDFTLMLAILFVVGGLTYTNPFPQNKPLYWQESQNGIAITAAIQPNHPGVVNSFELRIRMPGEHKLPKRVEMWLKYQGEPAIAAIRVPLAGPTEEQPSAERQDDDYLLYAQGPLLPVSGKWRVEIRVLDMEDNETVFDKDVMLYQVNE